MESKKDKKIAISGIKPTGRPHLGNYFGMMQKSIQMQEDYETFLFIADYHALTSIHEREVLESFTRDIVLDYLALGIDPEKTIFYRQSRIPEVTELTWIFNNLVTVPWLERAHAFKDSVQKNKEAGVGLFDYPVLMAADILISPAQFVPVGKDQIQHIEMTREIARKFNQRYGKTFQEPQELIQEELAIVPGTDGRKMSKSYGNTISLFADEKIIKKQIMSIITDSKGKNEAKDPETCNIFALHKLITPKENLDEIRTAYENGTMGYGDAKKMLLNSYLNFIEPFREKRAFYEANPGIVRQILDEGERKMKRIAETKMREVREKVGLEYKF